MNATAQQQTTVVLNSAVIVINTSCGPVSIHGLDAMGAWFRTKIEQFLNDKEFGPTEVYHGVENITFRTDGKVYHDGQVVRGNCCPDHRSVAINLRKCIEAAVEDTIENPHVSLLASFLAQVYTAILHEIYHLVCKAAGPEANGIDEEGKEADEEVQADDYAERSMYWHAKTGDLEPPMPEAGCCQYEYIPILAEAVNDILRGDGEWVQTQRAMLERGFFFDKAPTTESEGLKLWTFKQYCHLVSQDSIHKPDWNGALQEAIDRTAEYNRTGIVDKATAHVPTPAMEEQPVEDMPAENTAPVDYHEDDYNTLPPGVIDVFADDTPQYYPPMDDVATAPEPANPVAEVNPVPTEQYTPPVQPTAPPAPVNNTDYTSINAVMHEVYRNMVWVFNQQCQPCPKNPDGSLTGESFGNPKAVCSYPLELSPAAQQIIVAYDWSDPASEDAQGRLRYYKEKPVEGGVIYGNYKPGAKLPAFNITLQVDGQRVKRLILPQNIKKASTSAEQVKQGNSIAWVIDDRPKDDTNPASPYLLRIFNNDIDACYK